MADHTSDADPTPQVLHEIQSGQGLSLSAAGRLFPAHRGSGTVDPSTVFRWVTKGANPARPGAGLVLSLVAIRGTPPLGPGGRAGQDGAMLPRTARVGLVWALSLVHYFLIVATAIVYGYLWVLMDQPVMTIGAYMLLPGGIIGAVANARGSPTRYAMVGASVVCYLVALGLGVKDLTTIPMKTYVGFRAFGITFHCLITYPLCAAAVLVWVIALPTVRRDERQES